MELIDTLRDQLTREDSFFRSQLLREDIARLETLRDLARAHAEFSNFAKEGLYIGWTQGDFRTHELLEPLNALLKAVHAYERGGKSDDGDAALRTAWASFDRCRMEKLIGCL